MKPPNDKPRKTVESAEMTLIYKPSELPCFVCPITCFNRKGFLPLCRRHKGMVNLYSKLQFP